MTRRRDDLAEVNVEAVRAHQQRALLQIRANLGFVDVSLHFIGQQNVNEIGLLDRIGNRQRLEAVADGEVVIRTARALADDDVTTAVSQVLGLSVSLAAIAQDGDDFVLEEGEVGVGVVVNGDWHVRWSVVSGSLYFVGYGLII